MTSKRANAVNRAIAEACGWTDISSDWSKVPPSVKSHFANYWKGDVGYKPKSCMYLPIPDYDTDLNEAMGAAGELLNYGLHIYLDPDNPHIVYKNGKRDEFGDLWTTLPAQSNAPADIAAAICEAIVTARGLVVESEVSDVHTD